MTKDNLPTCTCIPGTGYRDPSCEVHGDHAIPATHPLNKQMEEIAEFVHQQIINEADYDHCQICNRTADQFHLWEQDKFPLWLSYVVAGLINEFK